MSVISVQLSDLNDQPLRNLAGELGIDIALSKNELIAAIKEKISPNAPLTLSPFGQPSPPKWWKTPTIVIPLLALIVAVAGSTFTALASLYTIHKIEHDLSRDDEDVAENKRRPWKILKVYEIIDRTTLSTDKWTGMNFDEIRLKYTQEVQAEQDIRVGKPDLQPNELQSILIDLLEKRLVVKTTDNKYAIIRSVVETRECVVRPSTAAIQQAIIKILSTESGKYTPEKLILKVVNEQHFTYEDVYATLNCMKANRMIFTDDKGMTYAIIETTPPKIVMPKTEPAPVPMPIDPKKVSCCGANPDS